MRHTKALIGGAVQLFFSDDHAKLVALTFDDRVGLYLRCRGEGTNAYIGIERKGSTPVDSENLIHVDDLTKSANLVP